MGAGETRLDQALREPMCIFAQKDGAGFGQGLQTRGHVHGISKHGRAGLLTNLDSADHRETSVDTDAHPGPGAEFGFECVSCCS